MWNIKKDIIVSTVTMSHAKEPVVESEEISRAVWSKMPSDIVNLIIEQSDRATLHRWPRTCSAFHRVSSALLWKEIYIEVSDLHAYWQWTRTLSPFPHIRPEDGGIIDFLIRGPAHEDFYKPSAFRHEDLTASPRSRIRRLSLDARCGRYAQAIIKNQELEIILGFFALFLGLLESLEYKGPIQQGSLGQIVKFENLKHLGLRRWRWCHRTSEEAKDTDDLDFTYLSEIHSLSNLYIDELRTPEAQGLAQAVRHLHRLTNLSLSASPFIFGTSNTGLHTKSPGGVSPFIPFLEALACRGNETKTVPGDGIQGGLPRRLQTLVLDDPYHRQFPALNWVLQRAIEPCQNLPHLSFNFQHESIAQDFLSSIGLPVQQDGKMACWESICSVAGLEFAGSMAWKQACIIRYWDTQHKTVEITRISGSDTEEMA